MARKDELGRAGEQRAADYLAAAGYDILDRNWRGTGGELDIVARRDDRLAVVEVKTRRTTSFGHPLQAIDAVKLRRLWRLAVEWTRLHLEHASGARLRLDAIALIGEDPRTAALEHLQDLR